MAEQNDKGDYIKVPIKWRFPKGLESKYATNLLVTHGEHEFNLSFFELQRPPLLGEAEDIKQQVKEMGAVPADCVARITVAPKRMPGFIKALQENWEGYKEMLDKREEDK